MLFGLQNRLDPSDICLKKVVNILNEKVRKFTKFQLYMQPFKNLEIFKVLIDIKLF